MSSSGNLDASERLRLFLALLLPDAVAEALGTWAKRDLVRGSADSLRADSPRVASPRAAPYRIVESLHITLAFLGARPRSELDAIVGVLCEEAAATGPFALEPVRYRETRSVGMLVLDDPTREATRFAERLQKRLEELGSYRREARPWLPHVTVLRFRERPRLEPPLAPLLAKVGPFAPSEAAAFLSRLHPRSSAGGAQHEILERCPVGREPGG